MKKLKQKQSIKQKIKNFFIIPEEVFEEESSPKFEKVTLFTLTKNKLLLWILFFLLIINTLVGFDINYFYIRAVLGFIFLITIPGLLIMLMMKVREVGFWECLVYVVGLSISFIVFWGLAVNWILPWLNITDKPLSLYPILICFNIFLIAFWITAWIRNKDLKPFDITMPKLDWINRIFFIVPMLFPVLAILGAFILNNHGTNILTMIMLGGIAVYVFCVVIFRRRLNENVYPWALYWMGLALLLMFGMRSWFFMGTDVISEYHFFNLIIENGYWDIINYNGGYNVCLSVTILPVILNIFMNIFPMSIFKFVIPSIFSIILIILYLLFKKFSNPLFSFLAGFFFMSQVGYMIDMPSCIRQEIAFLAFALLFLILFNKNLPSHFKKFSAILFGLLLIVSHYSTGYITLALFLAIFISISLISIVFKKDKLFIKGIKKTTPIFLLLLFLFGFLWYSQITFASTGLINFAQNSINNFDNLFDEDMQMGGQSFLDQFKLQSESKNYNLMINEEIKEIQNSTHNSNLYPSSQTANSPIRFIHPTTIYPKFSSYFTNTFYIFLGIIKKLGYIFIFIGLIYSLIRSKIKNDSDLFLISLIGIIFFSFIVLITLIPFGSVSYGTLRLYQQGLIIFSLFAITGTSLIFKKLPKQINLIMISLFLILYFFAFNGMFNQVAGGNIPFSNLNNFGNSYNTQYLSITEINSLTWLSNQEIKKVFYASRIYLSPFQSFGKLPYPRWNIFPLIIKKDSYVYAGSSEVVYGIAFTNLRGESVSYNFPIKFLNDNKNKIYNNGGSEIFK